MVRRVIARTLLLVLFFAAGPASAWVEEVVEETEKAANNARCMGFVPLNDIVYVLNVPADKTIISADEVRAAMIELTRALGSNGRFAVTRGDALQIEASRLANTDEGSRELIAILDRVSQAAITIFVTPRARQNRYVKADVTLLVRRNEDGASTLVCTPELSVCIPVENGSGLGPGQTAYEAGRGLRDRRAFVAAAASFREAAVLGHPGGQYELGKLYFDGLGVAKDWVQAVRWFEMAAVNGHPGAQYSLGLRHLKGEGTSEDPWEAVRWFAKAAEQGQLDAQYSLGWRFFLGDAVPKSLVNAYMWWSLAELSGHRNAPEELERARSKMSPHQIETATFLAKQCREKSFVGCGE